MCGMLEATYILDLMSSISMDHLPILLSTSGDTSVEVIAVAVGGDLYTT